MFNRPLDCFTSAPEAEALPIHVVRPAGLEAVLGGLPAAQAGFLRACGFAARAGQVMLLPGGSGLAGAVLGLGEDEGPRGFACLPASLPASPPSAHIWRFASGIEDMEAALLGWALGAYRFDRLRQAPASAGLRLALPSAGFEDAIAACGSAAKATWLVRDLINMPANLLGPAELAEAARQQLCEAGASVQIITGSLLESDYPVIHTVGRGSARPPVVVSAVWQGSAAEHSAPLISLCGKGVCFDSGGYDLKPPASMLRMKKDMAGAAICLGLAIMIIEADLPIRLQVRLGCVENMVSGGAMRPLDIVKARNGLTVEIGNTDAEGRLVLCDLLAQACEYRPELVLDFATLTGAARVALGPDLPAMFSNTEVLAATLLKAGDLAHDPVWRLPLWNGYNSWLDSSAADLNNVTEKAQAGAIVAALFLQRFVSPGTPWAHFDVYAWNDAARPGVPYGGEAQAMRAAFRGVSTLAREHLASNSGRSNSGAPARALKL
jgi:leucyl aminopeptidase